MDANNLAGVLDATSDADLIIDGDQGLVIH